MKPSHPTTLTRWAAAIRRDNRLIPPLLGLLLLLAGAARPAPAAGPAVSRVATSNR